jgi:hypothetical protein
MDTAFTAALLLTNKINAITTPITDLFIDDIFFLIKHLFFEYDNMISLPYLLI